MSPWKRNEMIIAFYEHRMKTLQLRSDTWMATTRRHEKMKLVFTYRICCCLLCWLFCQERDLKSSLHRHVLTSDIALLSSSKTFIFILFTRCRAKKTRRRLSLWTHKSFIYSEALPAVHNREWNQIGKGKTSSLSIFPAAAACCVSIDSVAMSSSCASFENEN